MDGSQRFGSPVSNRRPTDPWLHMRAIVLFVAIETAFSFSSTASNKSPEVEISCGCGNTLTAMRPERQSSLVNGLGQDLLDLTAFSTVLYCTALTNRGTSSSFSDHYYNQGPLISVIHIVGQDLPFLVRQTVLVGLRIEGVPFKRIGQQLSHFRLFRQDLLTAPLRRVRGSWCAILRSSARRSTINAKLNWPKAVSQRTCS
jgi:hypothetical protein